MKCTDASEFVSALYDGERIPREAAEHLGDCDECRSRLAAYSAIGAELRRAASLLEPNEVTERQWEPRQKAKSSWWTKSRESMRIPRFAFALMLVAIFLLSGGLVLVRARPNQTGSVLWLAVKFPPDGKIVHMAVATDGEPGSDGFGHFSNVPTGGILSINARFLRRDGERVEFAVKTRYENPAPHFSGAAEQRLDGIPEQDVWVEPGKTAEASVPGLGAIQFAGDFIDHKPPTFFAPDDTVDPKPNQFRVFSPVLIRGNQVVFNEAGASASGESAPGTGVTVYWPGEGRFLFSPAPFKGAIEGSVFESQVKFKLDGQEFVLLTAVPVTRQEHIWMKHEPLYKPSAHNPSSDDKMPFLGGGRDFPQE
jgi:hypothetical protein